MGCRVSQVLPRRISGTDSEAELLVPDLEVSRRARGKKQRKSVLVQASQKVKATSGNQRVQKIIDKIVDGEDFQLNRWRCLETPDRAYYTLGPFAHLDLELIEARRLIPSVSGVWETHVGDEPDSFVRVYVDDCLQYSSRIIHNNRKPQWRDAQTFDIVADASFIRVHVYDTDSSSIHADVEPLGFVEFCIQDIPFEQEIDGWFELRFPQNLQGTSLERYAMHCEHREELLKFDARQMLKDEAERQKQESEEDGKCVDKTVKVKGVVPASLASRVIRRVRHGVSVLTQQEREDDTVQYNAGEIRLRMVLRRVVPPGMDAFARALQPSCFTYATFVQEEYLPQLDLQELVDDAMDIKIQLLDDLIFALLAFLSYIVAWKSLFLSGILLALVVANFKSELLAWGFWHFWLGCVLVMLSDKKWRDVLSTNGLNAPLNQEGLEMVAAWNETSEMHCFLMRVVEARSGQVIGMQELVHWAGTVCVGRGELEITFEELLDAMHELWFIDMPRKPVVKKNSLVYVDRRKGSVTNVKGRIVHVVFDRCNSDECGEGDYDMELVQPRICPPSVPRMFVPKSVLGIVATLQYHIYNFHREFIPFAVYLKEFCTWKKPVAASIVTTFLFARSVLAFVGFFQPSSWCHVGEEVLLKIRMGLGFFLVVSVLFCKARGIRVVLGIFHIIASYCHARRAPECWRFFKPVDEPYRGRRTSRTRD